MKTMYIKDLAAGQVFENEAFAIYEYKKAEDKNGKTYYDLKLGDKTGRISAKIWADKLVSVDTKAIQNGKVVKVSGKVDEFKGNKQLNIFSLNSLDETALDDFIESSMFSADEMFEELNGKIKKLENERIKKVLLEIINDSEISKRFKYWPAATIVHHEFRSGLLQHVLEMLAVAEGMERFYPEVDFDVLFAGIVLHDIGKVYELDGSDLGVPYTTEGMLHGHIYLGARLFEKFAEGKLTKECHNHILHLILSHHGAYEFGSPVLPATVEAQMLTHIDKVSARARTADTVKKSIVDGEEFSQRVLWLENAKVWKSKKDVDIESELQEVIKTTTVTETIEIIAKESDDGVDQVSSQDHDQIPLV